MNYMIDIENIKDLRVMNQTGLTQYVFPSPSMHPACWDVLQMGKNEIYLSLCSELTTGEFAKLACYHPENNTVQELAYLKNAQFYEDRYIRPSKFHTSMSKLPDGRIIMLTHTTDKAPQHPAWMPAAYYADPWEGFPGSSMMIYDPKTQKLEDLGIPVKRETLYGGVYNPYNQRYYAIGFLKGNLYEIDPVQHTVRNYGQAAEKASYRLVLGSDQNVYFTTRNGVLERLNIHTSKLERLDFQMPCIREPGRLPPYFSCALTGPDGRLYMTGMSDMRLCAYDSKAERGEIIGTLLDEAVYSNEPGAHPYVGCMGFDRKNVLYFCICTVRKGGDEDYKLPTLLMRWDFLNGGTPEYLGLIGTAERVVTTTCSMIMDPEADAMYIFGTNHGSDGPDITRISLPQYRPKAATFGPQVTDPLVFPGNTQYAAHGQSLRNGRTVLAANSAVFSFGKVTPTALWPLFSSEEQHNSSVCSLRIADIEIEAVCGEDSFTRIRLTLDGQILSKEACEAPAKKAQPSSDCLLPAYPGRQYKRTAALCVPLSGGRTLCATQDGLLAVCGENGVFSLGPAWVNGPVRAMCATADGEQVYGVAGDSEDIGMVFSYDDQNGLLWRGSVYANDVQRGIFSSPVLNAIAVSDDGNTLVIGAGGRMGSIYIYRKGETA
ncbi:MAG: hypothetical protein MJ118_02465 [Clostridia bacterium]|nr:hypothetical protein [Clostridia bacterium]